MRCLAGVEWGACRQSLKRVYGALIRAAIDYGCMVYSSASKSQLLNVEAIQSQVGLCDMDKKYISRFFDIFFDFDFNHDFDTNRHALSHILLVFAHLTCFCISYLSCTSCFALFFILLHILLFISCFYLYIYIYIYIYICSCVVLLLYNFYSLHCPLSGPDLIYISLLIIPCIIYYVTNKETLTFTVINAFCVNLKHIYKGNQLDLSQKVVTCL